MSEPSEAEEQVREVLASWAEATRQNRRDDVLNNHAPDLVIFDVLPPMRYDSAEAYRRSWDEWQPEAEGEAKFDLEEVAVTAGPEVAFAHCLIHCGGSLPDGTSFKDVVRATFCLKRSNGAWQIEHQHVSKPFEAPGG